MTSKWVADIPGLSFHLNQVHSDERGWFARFLELETSPPDDHYLCIALSKNPITGTLRGLHFQNAPFAEEKAIMCIRGSIFEVFVDLRRDYESFGKWTHRIMMESDSNTAFVPKGVAHGYQTLEENTWLLYGLTATFSQSHAQRISYKDSTLAIEWPEEITRVSEADTQGLSWLEFEDQDFRFDNDMGKA